MRLLKHVSELPDTYNLNKYNNANELNLHGWYVNLSLRKMLSPSLSFLGYHHTPPFANHDKIFELLSCPIQLSSQHDIPNTPNELLQEGEYVNSLHKGLAYSFFLDLPKSEQEIIKKQFLASEYLTTFGENWAGVLRDPDDEYWFYEEQADHSNFSDKEVDEVYEKMACYLHDDFLKLLTSNEYQGPHHEPLTAFATVNLTGSDEEIINSFKFWLKEVKQEHNVFEVNKHYSDIDYKRWIQHSILPFLDLTIWAEANRVRIPNNIMGEAIFSNKKELQSDEDAVRRTTKPLAYELIKNGVDIIRSQLWGPEP